MVVLRLTRTGKKKQAFYRIVAADSRRFVNSKFIEILGWYNPKTKEISLKEDLVNAWIAKGAQPSNTVAKLLKEKGVKLPDWVVITEKNRKPKKEPVVKEPKVVVSETAETSTDEPIAEEVPQEAEAPVEVVDEVPVVDDSAAEVPPVEEPTADKTETE